MGVKTDNLPSAALITEVIGHIGTGSEKSLATIPVAQLSTQLEASKGEDYSTLAELQADLNWIDGALAKVWGDAVLANRGVYKKSGDVGSGSWTRIGPLPENDLSESMRVPSGESINPFPDAATRANTVPMFDATGQPVEGPTAAEITNAQGHATSAAADRALAVTAKTDAEQAKADAEQAAIDAQNTVLGNAAGIPFAAAGTVVADNVQDAIEELDADIQAKADASALGAELPIGSTMLWMSDAAPSAFWVVVKTASQVFNRSTYHMLFDHYAPERTVVITSGSAVVTGIGSDQDLAAGMDVEGSQIPAGTTILSVDGPSQVTLSANATANGTTCRVFRYGNGDGSTTCNFPPFAGRYFRFGDPSGVINPEAGGAMGITQEDAMQRITGEIDEPFTGRGPGNPAHYTGAYSPAAGSQAGADGSAGANVKLLFDSGNSPGAKVSDTETRPKTIIGYIAVKVADGVDDPVLITAANVIQDLTNVISKAAENERVAKNWTQNHVTATASYGPSTDTELTGLASTINNVANASAVEITASIAIERVSAENSCLYIERNGIEIGSAPSAGSRPNGLLPMLYDAENASTMTVVSFTFIDTNPDAGTNAYTFHIRGSSSQTAFLNRTITDADGATYERATSTIILKELAQ